MHPPRPFPEGLSLYPYQHDACVAVAEAYAEGKERGIIAMATGLGKTVFAMSLQRYVPGRMLFLAQRKELIYQAYKTARAWNPDLRVGIEHDIARASEHDDIVIASVAGLGRKDTRRMLDYAGDHFHTIIIDESHHTASTTHLHCLERFKGHNLLIGLTATPYRSDGLDLRPIFERIIYEYGLVDGINDGYLSDLAVRQIATSVDLSEIESSGHDFKEETLEAALNTDYRNSFILSAIEDHAWDRNCILVFATSARHAAVLAEQCRNRGWTAAHVVGSMPKSEREAAMKKFEEGETRILVGCMVPTEGYDNPRIDSIVMARPTQSLVLFQQMVGRGVRLFDGKENCLLLDLKDNTTRHSIVSASDMFGAEKVDPEGALLTELAAKIEAARRAGIKPDGKSLDDLDKEIRALHEISGGRIVDLPTRAIEVDIFNRLSTPNPIVDALSVFPWRSLKPDTYVLPTDNRHRPTLVKLREGEWFLRHRTGANSWTSTPLGAGEKPPLKAADKVVKRILEAADRNWRHFTRNAKWRNMPAKPEDLTALRERGFNVRDGEMTAGAARDMRRVLEWGITMED